jgi:hypothetical protein
MQRSSLIAFTLLSLISNSGIAADQKRMPANACLLAYDGDSHFYDRGGARMGATNHTQNMVCPLVRGNTTNTNGLTNLQLNLFKQVSATFTCTAESYDQNGSLLKSVAKSTTQTGITFLSWGSSINASSAKGTYGIVCTVVGAVPPAWGDELMNIDYTEP